MPCRYYSASEIESLTERSGFKTLEGRKNYLREQEQKRVNEAVKSGDVTFDDASNALKLFVLGSSPLWVSMYFLLSVFR